MAFSSRKQEGLKSTREIAMDVSFACFSVKERSCVSLCLTVTVTLVSVSTTFCSVKNSSLAKESTVAFPSVRKSCPVFCVIWKSFLSVGMISATEPIVSSGNLY
ncbi:hypothetical protein FKM82_023758 [Ascaphus truei]